MHRFTPSGRGSPPRRTAAWWWPAVFSAAPSGTDATSPAGRAPIRAGTRWLSTNPAAIGTGSYDGGWSYEGELLLLDLTTGTTVSLLAHPREVRRVAWRDAQTLDVVLAIPCDEDEQRFGTTSLACSIRRDDWDRATEKMLRMPYGETPIPDEPPTDPAVAVSVLEGLCQERGLPWVPRRGVWAVDSLPDGRIVAALEGIRLECWSPMSGELLWQLPVDGVGCQVRVLPDERTALVLTQHRVGNRLDPSVVAEIDTHEGTIRAVRRLRFPAVVVFRADGRWAVRATEQAGQVVVLDAATIELGRYDLFNHFFDIRDAPDLLFLQGRKGEPGAANCAFVRRLRCLPNGPVPRMDPCLPGEHSRLTDTRSSRSRWPGWVTTASRSAPWTAGCSSVPSPPLQRDSRSQTPNSTAVRTPWSSTAV